MSRVVITGACGFIGSCLSRRLLAEGHEVVGIDSLSRKGSELHATELTAHKQFTLIRLDLSDAGKVMELAPDLGEFDALFHLAAQVAVTLSYQSPRKDFLDNATATFNVVELVRRVSPDAYCLYASTNKVYGHITVAKPIGMDRPLAPYTPYGVSKAVGEMYFTEYGRPELGLTTCSLRQSCIYGHHQFGVEDQGWLAWFAIANLLGRPITLYGDGRQVRDLLFVEDLVDLYLECSTKRLRGAFPVGGGPDTAIDLLTGLKLIEEATGHKFQDIRHDAMRPGDQPYFVADLSWTGPAGLSWQPNVGVQEGLGRMVDWLRANQGSIETLLASR